MNINKRVKYIISTKETHTSNSMIAEYNRLLRALRKPGKSEQDLRVIYDNTWSYWLPVFDNEYDWLRSLPYKEFLQTFYWRLIREAKLLSVGFHCELCNRQTTELNIHHRSYANHGKEHRNLGDLRVLCNACHKTQHPDKWEGK